MRRQLLAGLRMLLVMTALTGIAYPLVVTGLSQVLFEDRADGSLIERDGRVVGSALIGQGFEGEQYFQPRPSAAGDGYDGASSSASNLGPTNPAFLDGEDDDETPDADESGTDGVDDRVRAYREANGLGADVAVPVDAVTASASGLDPHISVANARLQALRVTEARRLRPEQVDQLIERHTTGRSLGFLGEPGVDVLQLNLALDEEA